MQWPWAGSPLVLEHTNDLPGVSASLLGSTEQRSHWRLIMYNQWCGTETRQMTTGNRRLGERGGTAQPCWWLHLGNARQRSQQSSAWCISVKDSTREISAVCAVELGTQGWCLTLGTNSRAAGETEQLPVGNNERNKNISPLLNHGREYKGSR